MQARVHYLMTTHCASILMDHCCNVPIKRVIEMAPTQNSCQIMLRIKRKHDFCLSYQFLLMLVYHI